MSGSNDAFVGGVIEGFYGRPWDREERHTLFAWLRDAGLSAYVYAPKDDLKHRALWREPYDEREGDELAELIRDCERHGLRFVYALGPGLDIRFSDLDEVARLKARFAQMLDLGVRDYALLFDDIPARLHDDDIKAFGTPASAQCELANGLLEWMSEREPSISLIFCPTEYCGRMAEPSVGESPYLGVLGEKLNPNIGVFWTGPEIVSETIGVASIREVASVLKRKPILWDNLHANDYDMRRLYLGPYSGRPAELRTEVAGILLNPNCQFHANFVPIRTMGSFVAAPAGYAPREAYTHGVESWMPEFGTCHRGRVRPDDLQLLGDLLYLPTELGEAGRELLDDFRELVRGSPSEWGGARERVRGKCERLGALYDELTGLRNRGLLHSLYPHLWELKELAQFMSAWVEWRQAHPGEGEVFSSGEFRRSIHRGGFAAELERLLPMDRAGRFSPARDAS